MYRFRTVNNLLDGQHELEKQEIYFAPSNDLNDPMEGFSMFFGMAIQLYGETVKALSYVQRTGVRFKQYCR
jgi:hypothetical protein